MQCKQDHRYWNELETLPESQKVDGRHLCAGCAYDRGRAAGHARAKFEVDLHGLLESQAGTVRHRDAHAAFALGYADGLRASFQ